MAFPYGSSMTNVELAIKFGWPSMIISIILIPITFLWSKLVAFPVWLNYDYKSKPKCMVYNTFRYSDPGDEDLFRKEFYFSETNLARSPSGWNCHVDKEGGFFFESFFGLINCLDIKFEREDYWVITPNFWSWLILSEVQILFHPDRKGHTVLFFFPLNGLNKYNPFTWATIIYITMAITLWGKWSFRPFMEGPEKRAGRTEKDRIEFRKFQGKVDLDGFDMENDEQNLQWMVANGIANESTRLVALNHAYLKGTLSEQREPRKPERPSGLANRAVTIS